MASKEVAMPESTKVTFAVAVARVPRFLDHPGIRLMRKISSSRRR
jgi:hypothetical protein